jgi:predicted RecB family nuclease
VQLLDGKPVYSATDLVGFLWCEHLTQLGRASLAGLLHKPVRDDPELELIRKRGFAHEKRYLEGLEAEGRQVTRIDPDGYGEDRLAQLREATAQTTAAIQRGDDVIYQATFFDGRWRGHADFLKRVDTPSDLGNWSYEVADTKLARTAKAGALLQMCTYTEMLEAIQGTQPEWMEVALGGSARAIERFRLDDYMAYYRAVKARFERAVDTDVPATNPPTGTYPEPVDHCDVCAWVLNCIARRRQDDHLSLVAGISSRQRIALVGRNVRTLEALGESPMPLRPRLDGTSDAAFKTIHEQARLQHAARREHKVKFELLNPIEAGRGLALLPPPSKGDLFFDIEGDPFIEEGGADGLEYLFGVVEPGDGLGLDPPFHAIWGLDREHEKEAFQRFIDLVMDRLKVHPDLHIYHYGAYEPSAVKRLMGRHATREEEVDGLLRGGAFVDLFGVVRQGVRVSQESYSIKKLEAVYGFERVISLRDAGSSIVNFELWLESDPRNQDILDLIRDYNRDDCVSNLKLRDWLEQRRASVIANRTDVPRPVPQESAAPKAVGDQQILVDALVERLTTGLPLLPVDRTPEQQATWLLAQLLDWHRREDKSTWWEYFHRLNELTDEDRIEDDACIGGLRFEEVIESVPKSQTYRYRFDPQDNEVHAGTGLTDPATGKSPGTCIAIDQIAGTLDLRRQRTNDAPHPTSVVPLEHYNMDEQRDSLMRLGNWVAEYGVDAPGPFRASRDLLLGRAPRVGQPRGAPLRPDGEAALDAAGRLGLALNQTCLAIQGPPGAGKTYTGARMIVALVAAGKRVGVTATAHKVIGNLLDEVVKAAGEVGLALRIGQKPGTGEDPTCSVATCFKDNGSLLGALVSDQIDVAGATGWAWAREDFADSVDVLFIDEAGQISLANVLAVAPAAKSIVLLGDPQQLQQPLHGSHPPGAEASALVHLLHDRQTIPPETGLFLEKTWRMHPELTQFTSQVFYESRLESEASTALQGLVAGGELTGTGLRWVRVKHAGRDNESPEEAEVVARLAGGLIGGSFTDQFGVTRPLGWNDILVVAPYNAQVAALVKALPQGARVGTVDKFQGQEAAVVFYSLTTSSPDLAPRGMEFLYSLNRLNVATSRARCLAVIVGSPELLKVVVHTPRQMKLANALCRAVEVAHKPEP